jgi:Transcriptional accessory protein
MNFIEVLSEEFKINKNYIENIVKLLDDGNTIPFIARYRKEAHGSLDDQVIRQVSERLEYLRNFENRKDEIFNLISNQEAMTDEINKSLDEAKTLSELEDIYRPFRPKRKTRASVAKEKGLGPLADYIFCQEKGHSSPEVEAIKYVDIEKGVENVNEALAGASDIIAENISDNPKIRKRLRVVAMNQSIVKSVAADEEKDSVYRQYYNFSQPVSKIAGHRVLAIDRGEKEGFLKVNLEFDSNKALNIIYSEVLKPECSSTDFIKLATEDSYSRLIFPSLEREIRNELTDKASVQAIKVFSVNLRQLLMQPPVKGKVTMGLDPGYRTGCKVAVVDGTGKVLDTNVIYPTHSEEKISKSKEVIKNLIFKYDVEVIAIGNGTASKETEIFVSEIIKSIDKKVYYMIVNEAGASVYSASKLAANEFPEFDLTLRSAISIARRLQDPLAELVKIDPKSIGVGQYQHDMKKKYLDEALSGVVEDCVNSVGVDLNTASAPLLEKVSGINSSIAKNIVLYREENGEFKSRSDVKKVPKLGKKAFEQSAGFLRVPESNNILDNTGVHPESYDSAKKLLDLFGYKLSDVSKGIASDLKIKIKEIGLPNVCEKIEIGEPTLKDIINELSKPGRDPRDELPKPMLREDIMDIKDLKPNMKLKGTVRNVIDFGAFIDIGVHQDGLVHISEICDRFIKHPSEVLKVGDIVDVRIISVDVQKNKISLSMKY